MRACMYVCMYVRAHEREGERERERERETCADNEQDWEWGGVGWGHKCNQMPRIKAFIVNPRKTT